MIKTIQTIYVLYRFCAMFGIFCSCSVQMLKTWLAIKKFFSSDIFTFTSLSVCIVNFIVSFSSSSSISENSKQYWIVIGFTGKCSVLHMLIYVGHEVVVGTISAGLELVCKHKPDTEHRNLVNQTPLALAVESKAEHALSVLVSISFT